MVANSAGGRAASSGTGHTLRPRRATLLLVADIQKRGSYTPRQVRERRAYQLAVGGTVAGAVGVIGAVLAIASVIGWGLPIVALIVAAICAMLFRRTTGLR